jgi:Zn-dependent M28 family amino/carboxypeptidase
MRSFLFPLSFACAAMLIASCSPKEKSSYAENDGLSAFSADSLKTHISVLAADDFTGRKPFSDGEAKTITYLKDRFTAAGLEPGNGNSYFQEVPMVKISATAASQMRVTGPGGTLSLKGPDDYAIWTDRTDSVLSWNDDEVVFAGYGVVAPEYNWNDYAGLDVKGKIVLILVNDPGFNAGDTSLFKGKAMTYYGRWTYKFEEAGRQGAKGCLIVHNTAAASYPFAVVQNNWNTSRLRLDNRGKDEKLCDIIGWVSTEGAHKLLAVAGKDSTLFAKADRRGFKAEPLGIKLAVSMKVATTYDKSHNVIGKITGSKYPDETIIYTAHWDHLGIGAPDETGDSIYNGALDNASATAGLLEIARGFKNMKTAPERTVIFLSVTAEEQGLWGSAYYAQNPVYPTKKTVANINMDVLNWFGKTKDVVIIGQGQSELEDILKEEVTKVNRVITYDEHPQAGSYYRSDHFNFAKVGIPALYMKYGINVIGKDPGYGLQVTEAYTKNNYHRPSDETALATANLDGAIDDLQLLFRVGRRLAFERTWPAWKEGSEFKAIRTADK